MGNYNCQECINKEVNIINELLLDNNIFSNDSIEPDNLKSSHAFKINNLKANKGDLRKIIEKTNLTEEQKNFVQKRINENSGDFIESQDNSNTIKLRVGQQKISDENINDNNENQMSQEEQKKIIEEQKEQIIKQNKIIEDQQLELEQQQNLLHKEEEQLKKQIEQVQGQETQEHEEEEQQQDFEGVRIKTLEPPKIENENLERVGRVDDEENNEQIIMREEQEKKEIEKEQAKKSPENRNILRQNIHPKDRRNEKEDNQQIDIKEEETLNTNQQQGMNLDNFAYNENQAKAQQQFNENIGLVQGLPQQSQSQRFKIETYEPIETGSGNSNDNNFDEINENKEIFYNNDDIYAQMKIKKNEPRDSKKMNMKKYVQKKEEDDINNIKYYKNYVQEKVNLKKRSPKDNSKSNIEYQFKGSFRVENGMNMKREERDNINKKTGPRDSKRQDLESKNNLKENIYYFSKNEPLKPKKQPLNKNEKSDEMDYENQKVIIQNNNINPISGAISNAVSNHNNYIQQQINAPYPYSQSQYNFVKKEIINHSSPDYFPQQKYNENNIINTQQYYSPQFNELNNAALSNNFQNLENYENEVNIMANGNQNDGNAVTLGPRSNQVTEININSNDQIFTPQGYEDQQYDYAEYQQSSQKEYDMNVSDRDNPLIYSDDKGNMNFLERQYVAYQDRMNNNNDY